jgi:cysteine-rich repeat protein
VSASCTVPMIGDPSTRKCVFCGNAKVDGAPVEACDDGNFVANDGCSACTIDAGFVCTGSSTTVSVC